MQNPIEYSTNGKNKFKTETKNIAIEAEKKIKKNLNYKKQLNKINQPISNSGLVIPF